MAFFKDLFSKEDWQRPSLDNLEFSLIDPAEADCLEKMFEEEEEVYTGNFPEVG